MTDRVKGASGASRLEDVEYITNPVKREEIKCVRTAGLVGKAKQLSELTGATVTLLVQDPDRGPQVMFTTNNMFNENILDFQNQHKRHLEQLAERAASTSSPLKSQGKTKEPSGKRARVSAQDENSTEAKRTVPSRHLKNRIKVCKDPVYIVPSDEFSSTIGANVRQQSLSISGLQMEPGQLVITVDSATEQMLYQNMTFLPLPESPPESEKLKNLPITLWRLPRIARGTVKYTGPLRSS